MSRKKLAAAVLSALRYAQGLLGFAGIATVLMKDRAEAASAEVFAPAASVPAVPR